MTDLDPRRWSYATLLAVAFGLVVCGALLVGASTSDAAFGAYNPAWDGTSDLRTSLSEDGTDARVLRETGKYDSVDPSTTTAIVVSPDRPYTDEEVQRLRTFVENGGRLVVADDFGNHSNDLLAALGADARLDGRLLRDEQNYFRSPALPVATTVSNASAAPNASRGFALDGVDRLTLNYATVVEPNGAQVLVTSSPFGYLDTNGNGTLDDDEVLEAYPVVTAERVGNGTVVVVSDPSVFINSMLDQPDNRAFAGRATANSSAVLLDYSHTEDPPPLRVALLELRETAWLQALLGTLVVFGIGLVAGRPGASGRLRRRLSGLSGRDVERSDEPVDREALVEYLAAEHEDWDRERVRRIVEATTRRSERSKDD